MHPDADKINIASGLKLKWSGVIDLGDFYTKLKLWFDREGYGDEFKSFKEVKYVQRMKPNGKEIDIKWIAERDKSDYFSNSISITFMIMGIKDVEVQKNGKKVKMNSLNLEIKLFADLVKNRKGRWKKNSIMKKIYENFVIKERIDSYKLELYQQIYILQDEIKDYLNLYHF